MKKFLIVLLGLVLQHMGFSQSNAVIIHETDTEADIIRKAAQVVPSKRQLEWQRLELTAFIHFGMNTFTGTEWGTGKESPALFNPTQLDAEQWVRVMKNAGFKQIILTAKHHDGFCLWPTKTTQHSVQSSPWKNGKGDVVREMAEACKKQGVGFGLYLSPWDMNIPIYGTDAYNDFFVAQLTELLTQYGTVKEVWFDGANGEGPNGKKQVYDFDRWYQLIRKLQPEAVIAIMGPDVRWVGTETGKGREMEWSVVPANNLNQSEIAANSQTGVAFKPQGDMRGDDLGSRQQIVKAKGLVWYPAETDVSIRPGWFYHQKQDSLVKTPEKLNQIYFTSVGMNGVLLLNVPPDKRGLINEHDIKSLEAWTQMREKTFAQNLLSHAAIKARGRNKNALKDGKVTTYFTTRKGATTATIRAQFKKPVAFDILSLQEDISQGQRVEKFSAYYRQGRQWIKFTEGSTIGYKRLLRFNKITTNAIKIEIEAARLHPTIAEIGVYLQQ